MRRAHRWKLHCAMCNAALRLLLLNAASADSSENPSELGIPGRSIGIPACNDVVPGFSCHRTDSPSPPDICIQRDPDNDRVCLQTQKAFSYEDSTLPPTLATQLLSDSSAQTECDASNPSCIPDGVHKTLEVDWTKVEGAEYMLFDARISTLGAAEGIKNIYVDVNHGSDTSGRGTRESPLKSTRAALRKWLFPGKCYPFCAHSSFSSSAVIHIAPGVYFGDENSNIEIILSKGAQVDMQFDALHAASAGDYGRAYTRRSGCELKPTEGGFWVKAAGDGALSLKGFSLSNSSSDAIITASSVQLITDLHFSNGRRDFVSQSVDSSGNIVRSANWVTGRDQRVVGKEISCNRFDGCDTQGQADGFDARLQGPLPLSSALCQNCWVPVPAGWTGGGAAGVSRSFGLAAAVTAAGQRCVSGGTLYAKFTRSGLPGSGFSATFTVENSSVTAVSLADPGSGYVDAGHVTIEIESGGEACAGVEFRPFLVFDSSFPLA